MDIIVAITLFILALLIGVEVIGKVPATQIGRAHV
mgnify:CR=1 FL=1